MIVQYSQESNELSDADRALSKLNVAGTLRRPVVQRPRRTCVEKGVSKGIFNPSLLSSLHKEEKKTKERLRERRNLLSHLVHFFFFSFPPRLFWIGPRRAPWASSELRRRALAAIRARASRRNRCRARRAAAAVVPALSPPPLLRIIRSSDTP